MKIRLASLLVGGLSLLQAQSGPKFNLFVINDFLYQNNLLGKKQEDWFSPRHDQYQNALSVNANYGRWSGGLTLRGTNFYRQRPDETLSRSENRLHRAFVKYSDGDWSLTGGDFYAMLGRGLVLSVVQNDKTLRERTIQGGDLHYQREGFEARVLAGTVSTETGEQSWHVKGAEASWAPIRQLRLGIRTSDVDEGKTFVAMGQRRTSSVSLGGDNLWESLSYYSEAARLSWRDPRLAQGHAVYHNLTFQREGVTLLAEYKKYKHFDNQLNNAPLADRDDEYNKMDDSMGYRLLSQYAFREPDVTVFFNMGRYREYDVEGNNVYGGFSVEDLWDRLSASLQYGSRKLLYAVKKTDATFTWRFDTEHSLQAVLRDKRYWDKDFRFHEKDLTTTYSYAPWGSLFAMYQFGAQKVMERNHMWSGGVRGNLKNGSYIEVSGGRQRGGEVCSGGTCLFLPPFHGWKLAAHMRF